VVADGMGGHARGEDASRLAIEAVAGTLMDRLCRPFVGGAPGDSTQAPISDALVEAVEAANASVRGAVQGAGTTLSAAVLLPRTVYVAHVGDSRVYIIHDGSAEQVTRDHSVAARLVEMGEVSLSQSADHPQRNLLYRAIGQEDALQVDVEHRPLSFGDSVVLCTDGLWSTVSPERIAEVLETEHDPQRACDRLVAEANSRGGEDNITVLVARVEEADVALRESERQWI